MLVEYFGASKSIPRADRMACVAAKWVPMNLPHPPIIANLCANIYRENRYDYVLEDPPANLMITRTVVAKSLSGCYRSWFLLEIIECVGELGILMKIYTK